MKNQNNCEQKRTKLVDSLSDWYEKVVVTKTVLDRHKDRHIDRGVELGVKKYILTLMMNSFLTWMPRKLSGNFFFFISINGAGRLVTCKIITFYGYHV